MLTDAPVRPSAAGDVPADVPFWRRPVAMSVALLAMYAVVSLALNPAGNLGSDVGGKVATVDAMADNGSPDLGYWAEVQDPDGSLYPMFGTVELDGAWVNATSFPMLVVAEPLYRLGGIRLALLVPMLGGLATALAARALSRRLMVGGDGALAFWGIGLASSAAVYSLAFWEHSLGLAAMAWGLVLVIDVVERPALARAAGAGLLFGAAATMRQEALVYGFVAGLVLLGACARRRGLIDSVMHGGAMVVGTAAALAANTLLEVALLGSALRNGRTSDAATSAGDELSERVEDAFLTTLVPMGGVTLFGVILGLTAAAGLVMLVVRARSGGELLPPAALVGAVYGLMFVDLAVNGLRFVPSLLGTAPLAVVGATLAIGDRRARTAALIAIGALPLVLAFQYTGGLGAQWGGRYLLMTGWTLSVIALALIEPRIRSVVLGVLAVGAVASGIGVAWSVQRADQVGDAFVALEQADYPVLVFYHSLNPRGAGPIATENRWLAAETDSARAEAADVVVAVGEDWFGYVEIDDDDPPPDFPGFAATDVELIPFLGGFDYRVTTYRLEG